MRKYNKRQNNKRTVHPCEHTENRLPKKASPNSVVYEDVAHARQPEGPVLCNARVLGVVADVDEHVTCHKCLKLLPS